MERRTHQIYKGNKKLLENVKTKKSLLSISKGLMFSPRLKKGHGVILQVNSNTRVGSAIHMVFVFQKLDIIFLDKEFKVVDKTRLKPFSLNYTPKKPAKYVLETNTEIKDNIRIGEKLKILEK